MPGRTEGNPRKRPQVRSRGANLSTAANYRNLKYTASHGLRPQTQNVNRRYTIITKCIFCRHRMVSALQLLQCRCIPFCDQGTALQQPSRTVRPCARSANATELLSSVPSHALGRLRHGSGFGRWLLTAKDRARSQVIEYGISDGQGSTWTGTSPSTLFPHIIPPS